MDAQPPAAAVSIGRGLIGGHPYLQHIYFWYEVAVTSVILLSASYLVAKLRKTQEELNRLARHDSLTGLANRVSFLERLDLELARHRRTGQPLAVAILDCDNFKAVNDAHGHLEGDRLLRTAGTKSPLGRDWPPCAPRSLERQDTREQTIGIASEVMVALVTAPVAAPGRMLV